MIIQSARLLASKGAKSTADHVFRGAANERIVVLQGSEQALYDAVEDARAWRRKYGIRHFKIAPRETPTRSQLLESVTDLALEFGFREEDAVVIGHVKRRFNDAASEFHLHVLVPEVNPVTGEVLSSRWSYPRQEKVARVLEARWGHAVTQGAFNRMVIDRLRADGLDDDADLLLGDGLNVGAQPQAQYTTALVQEVKRTANRSLPETADQVRECRMLSGGPAAFAASLAQYGLRCVPGRKDARWIIEVQDEIGGWSFAGALHRLLKTKVQESDTWMGGWKPPTEEKHDDTGQITEQDLGNGRVRRVPGRNGRAAAAQGDGPAGHDSPRGRSTGRGKRREPPDEPAGQGGSDRRRDLAVQDRIAAYGASAGTPRGEAAAERIVAYRVAAGGTASGRSSAGRADIGGESRAEAEGAENRRAALLRKLLDAASLEQHFRRHRRDEWLGAAVRSMDRHAIHPAPEGSPKVSLRCAEDPKTVRERRLRFLALLVRREYKLSDYLPVEAVLALRRVDADRRGKYILLTLWSGTQILDTGDKITVKGPADDVTVAELAACVARRGWQAVEVDGDPEFRVAAARELLRAGVEVLDCPLSDEEQAELRGEAAGLGFDGSVLDAAPAYIPVPPWSV